ncbi:MAG TPA: transporter [Lacipirellulaceae bacterium]|nr:transporter [Lacipirellulaceae bacterium]
MLDFTALFAVAISSIDALIVVAYVLAAASLGVVLGRGQKDNRDFFLADHRLPTWALLLSIVATETSTVTFLSIPGLSYTKDGNFAFLQVALGYVVGRLAIVIFLLPSYFRGEMLTAYEVLEQRYGVATRRLASLVFLVMRNVADGLRLLLAAMVLNKAFGLDYLSCVLAISAATAIYSCCGGVRSVVWNDCLQFGVYMLGAVAVCIALFSRIPGGWDELVQFGNSTGRWRLFDFAPSLTRVTFWSGLFGGAFLTLATHGADHMMVQRYLCARSQSSASRALALSGLVVFLQFAFFLFLGVQLAWFFTHHVPPTPINTSDQALVTFVVHYTSTGLRGLVLAAVFSASMSSSLNSVTSSLMNDWFSKRLEETSDAKSLILARTLTIIFAVVQAAVALVAYKMELTSATIDQVLGIASFSMGLILGLYFLGITAPRTSQPIAFAAFLAGTIVTCCVAFGTQPFFGWKVHWLWYALVGSGTIVIVGLTLTTLFVGKPQMASSVPSEL